MKLVVNIFLLISTVGSMIIIGLSGYNTFHTTGQLQSGWGMTLFLAIAVLVILCEFQVHRKRRLTAIILIVLSILCATVFGTHYFGGDSAIKALLMW